jgi:hypothetical protein
MVGVVAPVAFGATLSVPDGWAMVVFWFNGTDPTGVAEVVTGVVPFAVVPVAVVFPVVVPGVVVPVVVVPVVVVVPPLDGSGSGPIGLGPLKGAGEVVPGVDPAGATPVVPPLEGSGSGPIGAGEVVTGAEGFATAPLPTAPAVATGLARQASLPATKTAALSKAINFVVFIKFRSL